ncbi:hypothetical protein ACFQUU_25840 [Herbaspirillum sp. GCM10030257]|uniref:hypothetical protein n=1 Tax=Herbaspirillum sp. GCM10030257 TaxID=3273393 RepID=UPI003606708B
MPGTLPGMSQLMPLSMYSQLAANIAFYDGVRDVRALSGAGTGPAEEARFPPSK